MQKTVDQTAKATGFPGDTREFRGYTIYEMPDQGRPQRLGFGLIGNTAIISTDIGLIERAAREASKEDSLASSETYRAMAKHLPAKTSAMSINTRASDLGPLYRLVKSEQFAKEVGIDFTSLPKVDAIKKYFPPEVAYAVPDDGGVLLVEFALRDSE